MSNPIDDPALPQIDFQITSTAVAAKPRKLKMVWSMAAADDLRGWTWPRLPDNALDLLKDALEDPNYDPDAPEPYKGLWRHEDGRVATPEEVLRAHPEQKLISDMADEMAAEIDREIIRTLSAGIVFSPSVSEAQPKPKTKLPIKILNAIELAHGPRWAKDAAKRIVVQNLS